MPYHLVRRGDDWCVAKEGESAPLNSGACHPTKEEARKQLAAIVIAEEKRKHARMAAFALERTDAAPGGEEDELVYRSGLVFRCGEYPDKDFVLTPEEARAAVLAFRPCPIVDTHLPSLFNGKLGDVLALDLSDDGTSLVAVAGVPRWLADVLGDEPLKVSSEWDRETKRFQRLALVPNPRVPDAALYAAFAGQRHSAADQQDLQSIHDLVVKQGARCAMPAVMSCGCKGEEMPTLWDRFKAVLSGVEDPDPPAAGGGVVPPAAPAPAPVPAAMSLPTPAPAAPAGPSARELELEAELKRVRLAAVQSQAAVFAETQIRENRALPAEREAIVRAHVQAALDDLAGGQVAFDGTTRLALLEAQFAARTPHLDPTQELLPGTQVLPNRETTPDPASVQMSDERLALLLGQTPLGQAVLSDRQKGGR